MWRWARKQAPMLRLQALLALDGDPRITLFPELARTRESLARDRADGSLTTDVDPEVAHALTAATYLGYAIFRETIARDLGISPGALDPQAESVYQHMLNGLTTA